MKFILDIIKSKIKEKVVGGDCLFKLYKGGDLQKDFGKPCSRDYKHQKDQNINKYVYKYFKINI